MGVSVRCIHLGVSNGATYPAYYDDVRIFPMLSNQPDQSTAWGINSFKVWMFCPVIP